MQRRDEAEVISVGNWIVTFIVLSIPLVNLVVLAYWAFGNSALPSKRNFAQAAFVLCCVGILLYVVGALVAGTFNLFAS